MAVDLNLAPPKEDDGPGGHQMIHEVAAAQEMLDEAAVGQDMAHEAAAGNSHHVGAEQGPSFVDLNMEPYEPDEVDVSNANDEVPTFHLNDNLDDSDSEDDVYVEDFHVVFGRGSHQ
ncbi:hypothetical protein PR202_ga13119 [Eleusine coracana subsp. coracana]|uniref:Uncharacterized protein n=1 Tax=Eleusine coracana subsp. coracana TaxID=191504 RepID=A0AAV5CDU5_ELECO|nr:hypothetical protein PR202_ga13119 [Eleusine coracana subsp. coracana]